MSVTFRVLAADDSASSSKGVLPFVGFFSGDPSAQRRLQQVSFRCFSEDEEVRGRTGKTAKSNGRRKSKTKKRSRTGEEEKEEGDVDCLPPRKIRAESRILSYEGNSAALKGGKVRAGSGTGSSPPRDVRYAVGVLNRASNTIHILPTDPRIVCLRPRLRSRVAARLRGAGRVGEENGTGDLKAGEEMDYYEKRQDLTEAFGSRRSLRAMRSAEVNRVMMDNIAGKDALTSHLESSTSSSLDASSPSLADAASEAARRSRLPPYHETEEEPEDAYPWTELATPEERAAMKSTAKKFSSGFRAGSPGRGGQDGWDGEEEASGEEDGEEEREYKRTKNAFVLKLIRETEEGEMDITRAMQLVYLECLLFLTGAHGSGKQNKGKGKGKDGKKRNRVFPPRGSLATLPTRMAVICGVPEEFARLLLLRFRSKTGKGLQNLQGAGEDAPNASPSPSSRLSFSNPSTQDRIVSHIAVLTLMLQDWHCDASALARALGFSLSEMLTRLKDIGCKITRPSRRRGVSDGSIAARGKLMTPLEKSFPKIKRARKKQR